MRERHIRCTRENADEFRALIAAWPELKLLTDQLRECGALTSMGAISVTLRGAQPWPLRTPADLPPAAAKGV